MRRAGPLTDPPTRRPSRIIERSSAQHPNADTELHYRNAVRAAGGDDPVRAVDRRARQHGHAGAVRRVSGRARAGREREPARARASDHLDRLLPAEIEGARSAWPARWSSDHGGEVPADMDALTKLPGVGRKTANVVLGHALGVPGPAGRSPRAARREPDRHRAKATIR